MNQQDFSIGILVMQLKVNCINKTNETCYLYRKKNSTFPAQYNLRKHLCLEKIFDIHSHISPVLNFFSFDIFESIWLYEKITTRTKNKYRCHLPRLRGKTDDSGSLPVI